MNATLKPGIYGLSNGQVIRVKFVAGKRQKTAQLLIHNCWLSADALLEHLKPWQRLEIDGLAEHVRKTRSCPWCRQPARATRNPLAGAHARCILKVL